MKELRDENGAKKLSDKHLRRPAVEELTGLARSTLYDLMSKG